jgi:hypothetical protein
MKRYCLIEGCENEVRKRSKRDICDCCSQGLRYWDERDHSDVIERQRKLKMYQSRMGTIVATRTRTRTRTRTVAQARGVDAAVRH